MQLISNKFWQETENCYPYDVMLSNFVSLHVHCTLLKYVDYIQKRHTTHLIHSDNITNSKMGTYTLVILSPKKIWCFCFSI